MAKKSKKKSLRDEELYPYVYGDDTNKANLIANYFYRKMCETKPSTMRDEYKEKYEFYKNIYNEYSTRPESFWDFQIPQTYSMQELEWACDYRKKNKWHLSNKPHLRNLYAVAAIELFRRKQKQLETQGRFLEETNQKILRKIYETYLNKLNEE